MMLSILFAPPNTTKYMVAGYIVIFTIMAIYLASLALRFRSLHREIEALKDLEDRGPGSKGE